MRFIHFYLIGYFMLIVDAAVTLSRAGLLVHVSPVSASIAAIVAVGLGVLLAATSTRPSMTRE